MYFDQLLGAARDQKLVETLKINQKKTNLRYPLMESTSFCMSTSFEEKTKPRYFFLIFRRFLLISAMKSLKKLWNEQKRLKNGWKKMFWPALGCAQHPKAGQNTQQSWTKPRDKANCLLGELKVVGESTRLTWGYWPAMIKLQNTCVVRAFQWSLDHIM